MKRPLLLLFSSVVTTVLTGVVATVDIRWPSISQSLVPWITIAATVLVLRQWIGVVVVMVFFGFPVLLVALGTSGQTSVSALYLLYYTRGRANPDELPEWLCLLAIVALLVMIPQWLRYRHQDGSPMLAWLVAFAAILTGAFIVLLHFSRGPLANQHLGAVAVAAFGVATLLAPFYRIIAQSCLTTGVDKVFSPVNWWNTWLKALRQVKGNTAPLPPAPGLPPTGMYQDPNREQLLRWWDGTNWG